MGCFRSWIRREFVIVGFIGLAVAFEVGVVLAQAPQPRVPTAAQTALGTGFTYQGQLKKSGMPVNDNTCAMTFSLWDAVSGGTQSGSNQLVSPVTVTNGIFTVFLNDSLQFGSNAFNGQSRWLAVAVQCAGDVAPVALSRDHITAAPYALYALGATTAQTATYAQSVNPAAVQGTSSYYPMMQPMSLDLTLADTGLKGFVGGFSDGRYAYFVPAGDGIGYSGKVARVDALNFTVGGVVTLDLTLVDSDLKGFVSGFTDGRYGYFAPYFHGSYSGKIARVDLQNFTVSGVSVLDLTLFDSSLMGFVGGFTDDHYAYFVPFEHGAKFGNLARVDLHNFTTTGVVTLDLTLADSGLKGFYGGFTDGRYGYLVPNNNGSYDGKLARVDLQNFNVGGVSMLDLELVDNGLTGFRGGFTDGRYGYFVPFGNGTHGKIARVDLQNFTSSGVSFLDLTLVNSGLRAFIGGFTDGHYGYLLPDAGGADGTKLTRVDLRNFSATGVSWVDLKAIDSSLQNFFGGFTDGRYGYLAPNFGGASGKAVRFPLFSGAGSP